MNTSANLIQDKEAQPLSMNPKKFIVWLFIVSSVMMFAGWTSFYIVAKSEGAYLNISLPPIFTISTVIILLSSVSMHLAKRSARNNQLGRLKLFLGTTLVLGLIFLISQFLGFGQLVDLGIYFVGSNPVEGILYVLTGMHGLHIFAGMLFLLVVLYKAFRSKVHSRSLNSIEMCATFWHFLDGLWLYLFLFLQFNS
jgi:cytochrome c oxidase subunit 3